LLAWPQFIEASLSVIDQLADLFWAGWLGSRAIAGLGVAQTYAQLVMMTRRGFDFGTRAMVSRAVGAGNMDLASHTAFQGLWLMAIYVGVLCGAGILFSDSLLALLGVGAELRSTASLYMQIQFAAVAAMSMRQTGAAILQSAGDAVTPMKATVVGRILHVALSPFFVLGWLGAPMLGLAGLALANLLSQIVGCWMTYCPLVLGESRLHLKISACRFDWATSWQLLKIGLPASVAGAERGFAQLLLIGFVAPFGEAALAAYAITRRLEVLAHAGNSGVGQASGTLIGQSLGAGDPARAKETLNWAPGFATALSAIFALLVVVFPRPILLFFNQEAELLTVGVVWLQVLGLALLFMGPSFVYQQSFNIAGDTIGPLVITLIGFWVFQIPLAWWLPKFSSLGQYGIAWAITISMAARVILFVPYCRWGRWLRVKVI
jgi:putative MATE family efflux protein